MNPTRINKIILRQKMALKEIFSFAVLARKVKCSETAIHLAIERPSRFPNVIADIMKALDVKEISELTAPAKKTKTTEVAHV